MKLNMAAGLALCAMVAMAGQKLGEPVTAKPVAVAKVVAEPEPHVGKKIAVRGKVTEVCQMAGCWMALADGESLLRVKVNDGDIVFPQEAVGKMAVAEGVLKRFDLTRAQAVAQAKHEAEEQGRKFDESSIKSGKVVYQLAGTGAEIETK